MRIPNEEERVCSSFHVDPTDEPQVDLTQIPHKLVDDSVVVSVPASPRVVINLDVMNCVTKNLKFFLPLDP